MASKTKTFVAPVIRHVTTRSYAQTVPVRKTESNISKNILPSKTFVAALDNGSPVTRVTVAFKAGSRYEPQTELGIAHVLRSAAGLSTKQSNGFIMARKLAQIGASVTASGDREFIYYTLETTPDQVDGAVAVLANMLSGQEFRPWELADNLPRLKFDIAALPPQVRAVDLLHKAAYRRNLGNSLFISPKRIGKISSESLQHYATLLSAGNCSIAVVGDTLEKANLIAKNLQLSGNGSGTKTADTAKYYGGELRKEMGGDLAHVAVAVLGGSAGTPQSLALAIAARALGNGPAVKWGSVNTPLAKAIGNIGPFAAAGFSVSYSDSGLYGVVLSVPKDEANNAVKACAGFLKKPTLSQEAIKAAKNQLKVQVLSEADAGAFSEALATQGFYTGNAKSPVDIVKDIDALSTNEIEQALSTAAASKISMGAAGNLAFVPYVDEL